MRPRSRTVFLYWAPVLLWMLAIFMLSNTTSSTLGQVKEGGQILPLFILNVITSQYFVHPVEFGVLAALVYRLLASYGALPHRLTLPATMAWAVAYGVVDEIHQSFVPGRSSTLSDVALDLAGATAAVALILALGPAVRSWESRNRR